MGATAVSKKINIIDKTSTIREITLYDDVKKFIDYDDGGYFSVYDGTKYRYAYCSSRLYTNSEGDPTSYLICEFIGKDGNLRYMYTRQPDEKEELFKTITSNAASSTLISQEDNEFGCCVYLVNTKGSNGGNGKNGSSGVITSYDKYNKPNGGHDGTAGAGGAGGSAGISVSTNLVLDDGSDKTLGINASLAGMCGAGGGGGGGAGGYMSGTIGYDGYVGAGGTGGAGGTANNASMAYKIRICNGISIIGGLVRNVNSSFSGKNGYVGQTGYSNDNSGGVGGTSGDGHGGSVGGYGNDKRGGTGGTGGSAGSARVGGMTGTGTVKVLSTANLNSSTNAFSNSIASTGGMVITKIIGSFPD